MKEEIEEEKRVREEITNELVTTLGDEVLKLQDMLKAEKRVNFLKISNLSLEKKAKRIYIRCWRNWMKN